VADGEHGSWQRVDLNNEHLSLASALQKPRSA
jgi:hypothetical protein